MTSPALPDPVRYVACTLEPVGNVAPCTPSPKLTVVLPPIVFVMNWREVELDSAKLFTCCQRRPFTLIVTIGCNRTSETEGYLICACVCYLPLTSIRQNGTKGRGRNDGGSGSVGSDNNGIPPAATRPTIDWSGVDAFSAVLNYNSSGPFSQGPPSDIFSGFWQGGYNQWIGQERLSSYLQSKYPITSGITCEAAGFFIPGGGEEEAAMEGIDAVGQGNRETP